MDIADKIRYLRTQILKIDETEFAKRCGLNRRTLYSWDNGETQPCVENVAIIAINCNTTINYLLFDKCELEFCFSDIDSQSFEILKDIVEKYETLNLEKERRFNDR